jgi:hypothetical protein
MVQDQRRTLTIYLMVDTDALMAGIRLGVTSIEMALERSVLGMPRNCARRLQVIVEASDLRSLHRNRQWVTLLRDVEHQELQRCGLTRVLVVVHGLRREAAALSCL